ncbi:MAG: ChbG/HpnK family deacetylase [Desulfobacteraceae bacterium]|nr:ChbG/HpnK family deacetylase [Desulfobacteraceae bacterium]
MTIRFKTDLKFLAIMLIFIIAGLPVTVKAENTRTLAERLGFSATDKVLIINADDAGLSFSTNKAVTESMEQGLVTSASLMVPCAWFPQMANYAKSHPTADFGIHITLTSEWEGYRWSPLADDRSDIRGLTDPAGYFWSSTDQFLQHATPEEAEAEAREQILTAHTAGIDITHLNSHMATLHLNAKYYAVYIRLAKEFDLPLRMPSQSFLESIGMGHLRGQLAKDGILCPDFLKFNAILCSKIHGNR